MKTTATPAAAVAVQTIFLIGFRGVGKSSVGRELAWLLGWDFRDSDDELREELREALADFAAREGEAAFRARESLLIARLLGMESGRGRVLALGGGFVESPDCYRSVAEILRSSPRETMAVWLQAPLAEVEARLASPGEIARVGKMLGAEELAALYQKREPRYRELAAFTLKNCEWSAKVTAKKIAEIARLGYGAAIRQNLN